MFGCRIHGIPNRCAGGSRSGDNFQVAHMLEFLAGANRGCGSIGDEVIEGLHHELCGVGTTRYETIGI